MESFNESTPKSNNSFPCFDLRPWAKTNRYRFRYEESYQAERPEYRGDGRSYVEVLCKNGLIYPFGGNTLLAYARPGVKRRIAGLGPDIQHHQTDGDAEVFKFPSERLDQVAAILRPKRLPGSATLTEKQREILQKHAIRGGQTGQQGALNARNGQGQG